MTTRYLFLPTLMVFGLGLGLAAGWSLRAGRNTPRDVWDDARWWSKGFDDGLAFHGEPHPAPPFNPCGPHAFGIRDDEFHPASEWSAASWSVRWECPERPPNWEPFPCNGDCSP